MSIVRGPWRGSAGRTAELALELLDGVEQLSGSSAVSTRRHAFRKLGWSSTSPTGSVS